MARFKFLRYILYIVEIFAIFTLQQTPGLMPPFFGARPELVLPIALTIAFFESEPASMVFGILAGLLVDYGTGGALGFHGLLMALTCYGVATLAANLLQGSFFTYLLAAALLIGVVLLLQWLFFFVMYGFQYPLYALVKHYIPRYGYTLVLCPVAYYFNRGLFMLIQPREASF